MTYVVVSFDWKPWERRVAIEWECACCVLWTFKRNFGNWISKPGLELSLNQVGVARVVLSPPLNRAGRLEWSYLSVAIAAGILFAGSVTKLNVSLDVLMCEAGKYLIATQHLTDCIQHCCLCKLIVSHKIKYIIILLYYYYYY